MTRKSKIIVSKNTMNLFSTDLMEEFDLWDPPLNTLCNKVNMSQSVTVNASEKLKLELKKIYPDVFSEGTRNKYKNHSKISLLNQMDSNSMALLRAYHNLLDLKNNKIIRIENGWFVNLPALINLNISNNIISIIEPRSFENLSNLEELN
ncbi:uncharacterized protein LOC128251223 [Octopus bimaculoides]|uniref:uncharacterized protein LOC128251223 n=1 Tax=Octopus bimaculoides TaxID=37653 RepID=UPI0022E90131|nr:uncharacterized protein LOC128251223 [Octopus bimaculoides]